MSTNSDLHLPVMADEILDFASAIQPTQILDATFGRGGHTRRFLTEFPSARIWATDQDDQAIAAGRALFESEIEEGRLQILHSNFYDYLRETEESFDFILADLGVSSPQLDEAVRGFSFYHSGPLDMRMDRRLRITAADIVNDWTEAQLNEAFKKYGEVRSPYKVVRAICHDRKTTPFTDTVQLSGLIERVERWHKKGHHPATRFFLALRLIVNEELESLKSSLTEFVRCLNPDGRLAILTFHSLEDRIVKHGMREMKDVIPPINKKVIVADEAERGRNARSRSAKLRVYSRMGEP